MGRKPRNPQGNWCIVRHNELLRKLIANGREQSGLSLKQLEEQSGVDMHLISRYINGDVKAVSQYNIVKLAKYFNIRVSLDIQFEMPHE